MSTATDLVERMEDGQCVLRFSGNVALKPLIISSGVYRLMWDVSNSDISG